MRATVSTPRAVSGDRARRTLSGAAAVVLLLGSRPAACQAAGARSAPPGRAHHVLFYDDVRQRILLAGGAANDARRRVTIFDDLWSFDGTAWTALGASAGIPWGTRVAVGSSSRAFAFGGFQDSIIGDLRVLESDGWRRVGAHPSIVALEGGFVFDEARGRFVTFGGNTAPPGVLGDVWEYDGRIWSKHPAAGPPARGSHAMVYDARRRKIVVFGGMGAWSRSQPAILFDDTWEFDGSRWTQRTVTGPSPRLGAGSAYDSKRGLVLLFGGANHEGVFNDLWSWNGIAWTKLAESGPEPRVMGHIAYDKRRDRLVLFGGRRAPPDNGDLGDTWEWDGAAWRRIP